MAKENPWQILGVQPGTSPENIHRAYLRLVRKHHPDQFPYGSDLYHWHENRLKLVNAAYHQVLESPPRQTVPPRTPPRPEPRTPSYAMHCTRHQRWAVIYCLICGAALCSRCDPDLSGYCPVHRPKYRY